GRRLEELSTLVSRSSERSEIIVVSDGSTDATLAVARQFASGIVRVLELPERRGKAAALNAGCALARNEVIVFADTRQTWAPDALA
ncbi:glycosyltransferase, partial [Escherichia coli]|uniref:glycosyltransferase n=1 Tax=Escherichia coli TaxID=562 RepID=UPI0039E0D2E5